MRALRFCFPYLLKEKAKIFTYFLISIVVTTLSIMTPFFLGQMINLFTVGSDINVFKRSVLLLGVLSISQLSLGYAGSMIYSRIYLNVSYEMSCNIIRHIHNVSFLKVDEVNPIYLNQRINQDIGSIITFCIFFVSSFLTNAITFVVTLAIMLSISIKITLYLSAFLLLYGLIYYLLKMPMFKLGMIAKETYNVFISKMNEQIQFVKFIKMYSAHSFFKEKLKFSYDLYKSSYIKFQKLSGLFSGLDQGILLLAQIMLYFVAGIEIINGRFTIGMFIIFSNYFSKLLNASSYFFNVGKKYQDTMISYKRINDILSWNEESNGDYLPEKIKTIESICSSMSYGKKTVIKDLNAKFEKGKLYAIVGGNGTGKSTLINALSGLFINEMSGDIKINGISYKECDLIGIRQKNIGITEQEPVLLNDSIYSNIFLGTELKHETVSQVFELLNLNEYLDKLTEGMDTVISLKNSNLSGGEKQKISIARALLKDPDVLILDEPTSALDQRTCNHLLQYLNKIKSDKIIIVVTHDNEISQLCDERLCL